MTPSDTVGANIRQLRKRNMWTVEGLAEQCEAAGAKELTANALYAIENGRRRDGRRTRHVTVDELTILATILGVEPMLLLQDKLTVTVTVST